MIVYFYYYLHYSAPLNLSFLICKCTEISLFFLGMNVGCWEVYPQPQPSWKRSWANQVPPSCGILIFFWPQLHCMGFVQDLCHRPAGVKDGGTAHVDLDPLDPGGEVSQAKEQPQVMAQHGWLQHLGLSSDAGLRGRLQEVITPEIMAAHTVDLGPPSRGFHS